MPVAARHSARLQRLLAHPSLGDGMRTRGGSSDPLDLKSTARPHEPARPAAGILSGMPEHLDENGRSALRDKVAVSLMTSWMELDSLRDAHNAMDEMRVTQTATSLSRAALVAADAFMAARTAHLKKR
jgi:hypothetical protein